jgi:hypothetical protein
MMCADKVYPDEAIYPTSCNCRLVLHSYCWFDKDRYVEIKKPIYIKKDDNTYELSSEKCYKKIEEFYSCPICGCKLTNAKIDNNFLKDYEKHFLDFKF